VNMGILSFLSDVKITLKFLFLVGSLALHKYGTSVAFINHVRCTDFQKSGLSVPPSQTQDIVQNSEIPRQNRQPLIRTLMAKEVAVYAEGQDASELFALYNAPPPECDSNCCVPIKTGILKARGEVHRDGDWHRSVHIWIGDDKGNLMLQRRSKFKDTFPNCWDVSAGGHITGYDSVMETAVREVEEEVGLELPEQAFMHVCCVPSRLKGTTKRHGDFYDNEFQDMYLVIIEGLPPHQFLLLLVSCDSTKFIF